MKASVDKPKKSLKSKISNIFGAQIGNSLQELESPSNEEERASLFFNLDQDGPDYDLQVKTALEKSSVFKFNGYITKCTETMHARASPDRTFFFINKVSFHKNYFFMKTWRIFIFSQSLILATGGFAIFIKNS